MDKDRFSDGVFFKWLNQKEIYKKYDNKGRSRRIQAYLDELHENYIATRPGTDYGDDFHGLFGYINENSNVEKMELEDIKKYVANKTLDGVDIYKTVISLSESDAIQYGYTTKKAWKNLLLERVQEIGKEFGIKPENLEWTASYHSKKNNPHCHLLIWNKNQNLEIQKKPFVRYKRIRKALSKSIFKLKLLCFLGFTPRITECANCKQKEKISYFSLRDNGFKCSTCGKQDKSCLQMSESTQNAIKYIVMAPPKKLFSFNLKDESLNELKLITKLYFNEKLEKG